MIASRIGLAALVLSAMPAGAAPAQQWHQDPEQTVAVARERAKTLAEMAITSLQVDSDSGVREACSRLRFAHEVEEAAARVSGDQDAALATAAKQLLIERLDQVAKVAEAMFEAGRGSKLDLHVAKFYLHHARAHLALLKKNPADARTEFDTAVEHAEQVAVIATAMEQEGAGPSRADDLFLPLRAKAERAARFSLDPVPFLQQLEKTCEAALARVDSKFQVGLEPASAKLYPQFLLEMTRTDLAAVNSTERAAHLRKAVEAAEALVDSPLPGEPEERLRAQAVAIRLLRDARGRAAAESKSKPALVGGIAEVQQMTGDLLKSATAMSKQGAIAAPTLALVQAAASLAELDALVPRGAVRIAAKPNDHQGAVRFRLWDKHWYRAGPYVYFHDSNTWVRISLE